ncbi:DsbA family protein [Streptosporangium sp. NPDC004379]|uniref:DsbA family protein n=1 Tax=Streptosporangium sp. NPDC004379 TaxID=3366189 RepID=UPI0036BDE19A
MAVWPGGVARPERVPAGASADGAGIVVGAGPVTVDVFLDFLCPFCRRFEESAGPVVERLAVDGVASVVYHPMGFLDSLSPDRYSSRAAAASGCAADAGRFVEYARVLFGSQPAEGGPGLSDEELVEAGEAAGVESGSFGGCVRSGVYSEWVGFVTAMAGRAGVEATPSVLVDGLVVSADASSIVGAVLEAGRG